MEVYFIPLDGIDPNDAYADEHIDHYAVPGELTIHHAASSYGLPVIVAEDGTPYGPGDIYNGSWAGLPGAPRQRDLEDAAARAGYVREGNWGETAETY